MEQRSEPALLAGMARRGSLLLRRVHRLLDDRPRDESNHWLWRAAMSAFLCSIVLCLVPQVTVVGQEAGSVAGSQDSLMESVELALAGLPAGPTAQQELVALREPAMGDDDKRMLGVQIAPVGEELSAHLGLDEGAALLITEVVEDSPAEAAGLKKFDVITEIEGKAATAETLKKAVSKLDRFDLVVASGGKTRHVKVTIVKGAKEEKPRKAGRAERARRARHEHEGQEIEALKALGEKLRSEHGTRSKEVRRLRDEVRRSATMILSQRPAQKVNAGGPKKKQGANKKGNRKKQNKRGANRHRNNHKKKAAPKKPAPKKHAAKPAPKKAAPRKPAPNKARVQHANKARVQHANKARVRPAPRKK